jgi:CRISPR-associated protein Csm4
MNSYCITVELRSGLGTPLAADTLWGHIAWGIRYREGEQALEQWLKQYDSEAQPPLVISDPLPAGFWPRPSLPPSPRPTEPPTPDQATCQKAVSKVTWISHHSWQELMDNGLSPETLESALADDPNPPAPATAAMVHIGVNRLTGGTEQTGGGALFTSDQTYYPDQDPQAKHSSPARFEIWALSPEPPETVKQWLNDALIAGYGRDASSGLGEIALIDITDQALPSPNQANAGILLGPTVPANADPAGGFFNFDVRCGRLGGDFAVEPGKARQKKPLRCLQRGSVVFGDSVPSWMGRLVSEVHPDDPRIRHYGLGLLLPCRLEPSLFEHPVLKSGKELASP